MLYSANRLTKCIFWTYVSSCDDVLGVIHYGDALSPLWPEHGSYFNTDRQTDGQSFQWLKITSCKHMKVL